MAYIITMENKKITFLLLILVVILVVSCITTPEVKPEQITAEQTTMEAAPQQEVKPPVEEKFDPSTVTDAQYVSTREEVRLFIDELNRIISNRNYNSWKAALSQEYFNEISSPEKLRQISEEPAMKTRKITLKTAEDYFTHVVVPSRANNRFEDIDIEFIERNRVKAFSINTNRTGEEQRLRLYDLEKIGSSWKIIN